MSDSQYPELKNHRKFLISRLFLIQFVSVCIITVAISLIGISLISKSEYDDISSTTVTIAEVVENYCIHAIDKTSDNPTEIISSDKLIKRIIDESAERTDLSLFLFNKNGECVICSENSGVSISSVKLAQSTIKTIKKNGESPSNIHDTLNLENTVPSISKGVLLHITNPDGTLEEYFLFANGYSNYVEHCIRVVILAGIVMVVIIMALYIMFIRRFIKKYMTNPQADLSRAIRNYAKGDYSEVLIPESFPTVYYQENAAAINQIISNLKAISDQQAQFVSNVSHELRTPMTIISGYVNGMLDGTVPKEKRTEYLYIVSQEMQRLKILVSSMLNLTKYDNGTIQIKHELFSINDLIFRTFLMFESRLEKRNINVEGLDCDTVYVYGDSDLIGQVVYNLTENAVKFVDTGGTISIRLEDTKNASVFAIRNTGSGISKDELPKIFGRFYKSDFSRSQDKTGLGLGLDIIRKILCLHDAQISVSSEENVFTEFSVSFPKKPDSQN